MFEFFVVALGILLGVAAYKDWMRTRDAFYPTLYLCPQLAFVYVFYPLRSAAVDHELFESLAGGRMS